MGAACACNLKGIILPRRLMRNRTQAPMLLPWTRYRAATPTPLSMRKSDE